MSYITHVMLIAVSDCFHQLPVEDSNSGYQLLVMAFLLILTLMWIEMLVA